MDGGLNPSPDSIPPLSIPTLNLLYPMSIFKTSCNLQFFLIKIEIYFGPLKKKKKHSQKSLQIWFALIINQKRKQCQHGQDGKSDV